MKQKLLISALQKLDGFEKPRIELEQYGTPPEIAAAILQHIAEDVHINGKNDGGLLVADLGCGTGVLLIGAALIGARYALGIDIDPAALALCRSNIDQTVDMMPKCAIDLLQMDLRLHSGIPSQLHGRFDVVLTNPPFGTKNSQGADMDFVQTGLLLVKPQGGKVFSLHKTSSREFLERRAGKWPSVRAECVAKMRWNLDQTYGFHRRKSVDIDVDLFCFERI